MMVTISFLMNSKPVWAWHYQVKKDDSLYKIAKRFGTTVNTLKRLNRLKSSKIKTGWKLWLPDAQKKKPMQNLQSTNNIYLLARLISGEARGESYQGQVAVGAVIMNRVNSKNFPHTIAGNIFKKGEFESVSNGQIWKKVAPSAIKAAKAAISGWDPSHGALYFYNPAKVRNKHSWIWSRKVIKRIGRHLFAV